MSHRTPAYRFSVRPFSRIDDGTHVTIQVRRVDGDPDGGPPFLRTSSKGVPLDEMMSALTAILGRMRASDDPSRPQPPPADRMMPQASGWLLSEGMKP